MCPDAPLSPLHRLPQRPRRSSSWRLLVPVLGLALAGCLLYVLWVGGYFEQRQTRPGFVPPEQTPAPHAQGRLVLWESATKIWREQVLTWEEPHPPREVLYLVFGELFRQLPGAWPELTGEGWSLAQVYLERDGPVTLDLRVPGWGGQTGDIPEEHRLLLLLGRNALANLPEATGLRLLFNGEQRRVFLQHLAGDEIYPRAFFEAPPAKPHRLADVPSKDKK
jgi:hypothetical protein